MEKMRLVKIDEEEKPHECKVARHIDDLGLQVDRLERRFDELNRDTHREFRKLWFKVGFTMCVCALAAYTLYGVRWSIDLI